MKKVGSYALIALLLISMLAGCSQQNTAKLSPFEMHGALHVENGKLTGQHGEVVQLYGMSTHGIAWFPQYVNLDAFRTLRNDWNTNCIRLPIFVSEFGMCDASGNGANDFESTTKWLDYF